MKSFLVDRDGYYGEFGGAYVPEILHKCVEELQNTYLDVIESEDFKKEFDQLLRDYVGRPSPLYQACLLYTSGRNQSDIRSGRSENPLQAGTYRNTVWRPGLYQHRKFS